MTEYERELYHHGVKGMKWGVRKKRESVSSSVRRSALADWKKRRSEKKAAKDLAKRQRAYDENVQINWYKAYNKAADYVNETLVPRLNKKYDKMLNGPGLSQKEYEAYTKEYEDLFNMKWQEFHDEMFGKRPE